MALPSTICPTCDHPARYADLHVITTPHTSTITVCPVCEDTPALGRTRAAARRRRGRRATLTALAPALAAACECGHEAADIAAATGIPSHVMTAFLTAPAHTDLDRDRIAALLDYLRHHTDHRRA